MMSYEKEQSILFQLLQEEETDAEMSLIDESKDNNEENVFDFDSGYGEWRR